MRTLTAADGVAVYFKAILADLVVQLIGSIVISIAGQSLSGDGLMTLNLVLMAFIQITFFSVVYFSARKKKLSIGFPVANVKWYTLLTAFVSSALCIVCFIMPAEWFAQLLYKNGYSSSVDLSFGTPLNIVLGVFVTVILAPICEELVFRGALLGGLVKKTGVIPAVILSGLAFSLMHMNPDQTVYQFFLGCVSAYFAICSKSVLPSMLLHSGNNLIALILEFIPNGEGESVTGGFENPALAAVMTVILAVVGIVAVFFIGKLMLRKEHEVRGGLILALGKNAVVPTAPVIENENEAKAQDPFAETEPASGRTESVETVSSEKKKSFFGDEKRALELQHLEDREDELDVKEKRRPNSILGKKTHVILLCLGLLVCVLMWGMSLLVGFIDIV